MAQDGQDVVVKVDQERAVDFGDAEVGQERVVEIGDVVEHAGELADGFPEVTEQNVQPHDAEARNREGCRQERADSDHYEGSSRYQTERCPQQSRYARQCGSNGGSSCSCGGVGHSCAPASLAACACAYLSYRSPRSD